MDDELIDNVVIVDSSKRLSQEEVHCLLANCGEITGIYPFSPQPSDASSLQEFPGLSCLFVEFSTPQAAQSATHTHLPKEIRLDPLSQKLGLKDRFISVREAFRSSHSHQYHPQKQNHRRQSKLDKDNKKKNPYNRIIAVQCSLTTDESAIRTAYSTCGKIESIIEDKLIKKNQRTFFVKFERAEDVTSSLRESYPGLISFRLNSHTRLISRYKKTSRKS
ncbi:hypothetical protein PNOK_0578800 [Pyrrhoderma noxium]|uniref:Uncharacterized protein n=1 Tax=Pyrrhoderma noxium TaxID=2282107 RepID=A0A286UHK6_9AGAM|nr:hypothetical protein PNOK_0578800 [Pyrrhoderma noxium]